MVVLIFATYFSSVEVAKSSLRPMRNERRLVDCKQPFAEPYLTVVKLHRSSADIYIMAISL
jgi:hypothetical protein